MKKTAPQPRLRAWASCLVVLSSALAWAQDADAAGRVFIQGSEINLRRGPSPKAEVVTKLPIATECQLLASVPKEWVRLKCGEAEGFTQKSLVGAAKPSFDALLAQALDTKASTQVRYDAASRAAALDSKNDKALDLLADLFFALAFEQLQKDAIKGGLHEAVWIQRKHSHSLGRKRTLEESFLWELEKIEYDWHQLRFRRGGFRGGFVSVMSRDGALVVYSGHIPPNAGKGEFGKDLDEFDVNIESRNSWAASEALKLALQKGARVPESGDTKYSALDNEYAGMPALSPAAFRLFRSLPPLWYLLHGKKGERHVLESCGIISGIKLSTDIHRRASFRSGDVHEVGEEPLTAMQITDVSKNGASYQLQLRDPEGRQSLFVLSWPTEELNVAHWDSKSGFFSGDYAVANARNIPVKENCTSDLGQ
ncbi:hypothetical protein [Archangium sp.]|jgi:hypothetical protein|uniref:hypothetical protein n=1 Tax=Archangium sp. TaxID=1872627 RepID=UPI002ED86945